MAFLHDVHVVTTLLRVADSHARDDSSLPSDQRGVAILGTPLGHVDFVRAQLRKKIEEHRLLDCVEAVPDLQCAWLIRMKQPS